ncbi:MAG: carboxy terminal-processing peptidase [Melioribacteraceae bacterium]|nr:carboxy terminal-processing peptidase [Melioribacteraceae bacterium]MCF8264170.1 carboxy terminal-processing peptidase [Melioribacteraceae bacterium]MCF8430516.1 carboxy terminal-processing peptidase [Melioribacteraceae bacterium]
MKKLLALLILVILSVSCKAQDVEKIIAENQFLDSNKVIEPELKHEKLNQVITQILSRFHYRKTILDDSLSATVFENYVGALDNNKMYFLKSDLDEFEKYRYKFDDYLRIGDTGPGYDIFNRFKTRLDERIQNLNVQLEEPFDFTLDESFRPDRKDMDWVDSQDELNEIWRKRLKNDALNLKLSGKEGEAINETLKKRYYRFQKTILQYKAEDVFQLYMNAYAEVADPHTSYFSPITSENFGINMSLSLQGIGAQLTPEDDYTKVARIIPGGPADKSKLLHEEDRIVGVAQGDEGEMIDVIGWRLDDVVQLIRGEKGTVVRLTILRADDTPDMPTDEIKIVRDEVNLDDQAAQSKIITINENDVEFKLGVIELPSFYTDFRKRHLGWGNYRSTTYDVEKLVNELKDQKVDGIVIDLRNNGGGSLLEAVELTGLFIDTGAVVQVRSSNGSIEVNKDEDDKIIYDGPMAVLINRYSASASEIFAGAIQDYGRGIVVGEQTYGKGTVQNLINLNNFIPSTKETLGQLKLTVAKFYRINGSSTQHKGVVPDIEFPSFHEADNYGESSKPTALPWDEIASTTYQKLNDISPFINKIEKKHEERIKNNLEFQFRLEDIEEYKSSLERKDFSLNETIRKEEREAKKKKEEERDLERQKNNEIEIVGDEEIKKNSLLVDDPLLEETGHILTDLIFLTSDKIAKLEKK